MVASASDVVASVSHGTTAWVTRQTINSSEISEGSWLILWHGQLLCNTAAEEVKIRFRIGTTTISYSDQAINTGSTTEYEQHQAMFTSWIGSGNNFELQMSVSNNLATGYLRDSNIVMIKIGELTYESDYYEKGWNSAQALTDSWVNYAGNTGVTGGGFDWLHLASWKFQVDNLTDPLQGRTRLETTPTGPELYDEPHTVDEVRGYMMAYLDEDNSGTFQDYHSDSKSDVASSTNDIWTLTNIVLKMQAFPKYGVSQTAGSSGSVGSTYGQVDTLAFTPGAAVKHLILWSGQWNPSAADYALYGRLQIDGTTEVGEDTESLAHAASTSSEMPIMFAAIVDFADTTEKTIDVDFKSDQASSGTLDDRTLIVIQIEDDPPTEVEILEAQDYGTARTTGTSYTMCSIPGSSFTNGDKYLIIYRCALGGNSASANSFQLAYKSPDSAFETNFVQSEKPISTSTGNQKVFGWMDTYTADGTNGAAIILKEASTNTAHGGDASIIAINLDDLGTDGTDYWFNSNTSLQEHTNSFANRANVTLTPTAGDDLLIIGVCRINYQNTSDNAEMEIANGSTRLADSLWMSSQAEDDGSSCAMLFFGVDENVAATSRTYNIRTRDDGGTNYNYHNRSKIFVLPLDQFESHTVKKDSDITTVTSGSYQEATTVNHTPTTTGDQLVLGGGTVYYYTKLRLQFDGTSDPGSPVASSPAARTTDERHSHPVLALRSIDTSGDNIDLDYYAFDTNSDIYEPIIVAFSTRFAGAPTEEDTDDILAFYAQMIGA